MRLRFDVNAKNVLEDSEVLVKTFPFKVDESFVIEMGMGKGEMLYNLALLNPNVNYLGVEKYATVAAKVAKKIPEVKLTNFFIINDDVKKMPELIEGKVNTIWLTFSDPWPKKRHEKRRLTHKSFLEIYKNLLADNGVLKLKTDNDDFFNYSLESLKEFGAKVIKMTRDFHNSDWSIGNLQTNYEKKWSAKGKNINYLEAVFVN